MRHQVLGRKFNRDTKERKALFLSLARALIEKGEIKTTLARAKTTQRLTENLVIIARRGDLSARRRIHSFLREVKLVNKLVDEIAPVFKQRPGGYTRIVRLYQRQGDNALLAKLEFVDFPAVQEPLSEKSQPKKEKEVVALPKTAGEKKVRSKIARTAQKNK